MTPNTQTPAKGLPLSLVVAALAMLAPFTIDTYLPSFPDIAAEFSASYAEMQQTLSLYLLAFAVSTLIYGPLSDSFGRRRVIMLALAIYTLTSIGCAYAQSIEQLILLRIGQGLSASAGLVVGRAMIRDVYHGAAAQRVMARVMLLFGIAPAMAPLVGGWLHDIFGWRSVFVFLALWAGLLVTMTGLGTVETLERERRHSIHPVAVSRAYAKAFRSGKFMALVFCFALMFSGFFLYVAGAPTVIYDFLGLGVNDFWVLFVPSVAAIVIGSQLSGLLAGRLSPARTVTVGFSLMFVAALLNVLQGFLLEPATLNVVAPPALYVLGMALTMPNLNLMALDCFPKNRGMASAMQSFTQMAFASLVVGAVVPLVAVSVPTLALTMLGLNIAGLLLWQWLKHQHGGCERSDSP
ncbi:MAG: multidrug effflux MFS transporter [Gammaproteobacteria bacterium]|nr:multidrug effflux MFS transporter [Gammaproteobacteria bacterium]MCW8839664.1 multidrug effflux MFS transporter [Gammaproteobacteria bacterium]MCW8958426.1 multidrug effflux MFS transporter [Gammaproteobacteria bacterium]MCW8973688.1 multidrug effflux MFS transporter [Gammaproteobacteria bacterium]MCW8993552.1 multidrug effflux MFS transporter [Gammaproteobacteria bacterium]